MLILLIDANTYSVLKLLWSDRSEKYFKTSAFLKLEISGLNIT